MDLNVVCSHEKKKKKKNILHISTKCLFYELHVGVKSYWDVIIESESRCCLVHDLSTVLFTNVRKI